MTLTEYADEAAIYCATAKPREWFREVFALGLGGECGEVLDLLKKVVRDGAPLDRARLCEELGDVLFYVSALGGLHGITLDEIARENLAKLGRRWPDGFDGGRLDR